MSHANTPPELPEVTDEAGDTPSWVPVLGVALFVVLAALLWWSHHDSAQDAEAARELHAPLVLVAR